MTPGAWARVKSAFARVQAASRARRSVVLRAACSADAVRSEVGRLLACADLMGGFLASGLTGDVEAWSPEARWPAGTCVSGRYHIVRCIGRGGMGEVYEADDLDLRLRVALKTIRWELADQESALDRFRREVALARRVAHPNVCRVYDLGRYEHGVYCSMELLAGETLEQRIARDGRLDLEEAAAIAAQICAGLDAAHEAGVIHRDLKTSNVMLVPAADGLRAVITDFGLARLAPGTPRSESASRAVTRAGDICGTPQFMAPEQVIGEPVQHAADLFALGVVLYRMVSGRYPYDGDSAWQVMIRRLTGPPTPLPHWRPDLPAAWAAAIHQCLARDPRRRPARARHVWAMLTDRAKPPRRRHAAALAIVLSLCAMPGRAPRMVTAALPPEKHVAVLPFTMIGSTGPSVLADGISESISARIDDLRRLDARLSSVPFADLRAAGAASLAEARRMFGITLAVTGTLRATGSRMEVHVRLLDARTGQLLREQLAAMAGDTAPLTDAVLAVLDIAATPAALARLGAGPRTTPSAYEFFAQGQGYLVRSGERDVDTAIDLLQRAVETQPRFALARATLARAYAKRYQRTKDAASASLAERAAADALRLDPTLAAAHLARGMVCRQARRYDDAVQAFQAALRIEPADAEALNQLANTYDELGDPLRAESTFERAIRANPGYWVGYNNLGRFYLRHRQIELAAQQFRWATTLAPDNARAHSNLGGVYLTLGAYADARATLQRAYELQPTAAICSNLGTASLLLGDSAHAIEMFARAVTLAPRDHRYLRNLGDAYEIAGRMPDARSAWTRAATALERELGAAATTAEPWATAALYRAKLREAPAARRWLAAAERRVRSDDPGTHLKMGQARELIGDRQAALLTLAQAVRGGLALSEIEQSAELAALRRDTRYMDRVASRVAP
jgi:tetratricopeptide (TPR) repeat protein/tRNA A-37 threonylcarbamoyl transferase component Bud32